MTLPATPHRTGRSLPDHRAPAGIRRRTGRRTVLLVALLATLSTLLLPLASTPAFAEEGCRNPVTGDDLPDNTGPYGLIDLLGLRHAWDLTTGRGVSVAVIDSGVDDSHPDLSGVVHGGSNFEVVPEEREFDRSTPAVPEDCAGHGTAIAGLIAARRADGDRMTGVAPGSTIYPVRIKDGVENSTFHTIAAMIDDAVRADVDVINLSLAVVADHTPIREAVERAQAADIVVVAAAGNEGNEGVGGGRMYPAAYPGVLAVAAVDDLGQPLHASNSGPWIDIAAYGEQLTLVAPGGSGYRVDGGTSFAAAQVSGAAALVRARYPELTAEEVVERLTRSAAPVGGGRNNRTGAGIVDPFGALTYLPAETGEVGDGQDEEEPESVAVQPLPDNPPFLSSTVATSLMWSGALALAILLGLLAVPAARRAVRRGWHAGPLPPGTDPADAQRIGEPSQPSTSVLSRLDGSDVPPPAPASKAKRAVAYTPYTSQNRT